MTPRQQRFVEEYLCLRNAAEAARRAGYSEKGAEVRGARLLRQRPVIAALRAAGLDLADPPDRPPRRNADGLTLRHQLFVEAYLRFGNATQAATEAGYSARSAQTIGSELLNKPAIAAVIRRENEARAKRTRITNDRVLVEYARIAFADLGDFVEWGPEGVQLKPGAVLSDDDRAAVAEIVVQEGKATPRTRIRLYDKLRALDRLARYQRIYETPPERPADPEEVRQARIRIRERLLRLARGEG